MDFNGTKALDDCCLRDVSQQKSPFKVPLLSFFVLSKGQSALSCDLEYSSSKGNSRFLTRAKHGCLVLGLLGTLTLGSSVVQAAPSDRALSLYNIHTKENLNITYKRRGKYDRKALDKINWFMRDWRTNQSIKMDPKVIDLLWEVREDLGSKKPVHIVSSYRSPKTNNMLRKIGRKVARNSQHTKGRALDVFFPDISTKKLRENALIREIGGVGYYPRSLSKGFVHIDTGSVRHWPRMHASTFAKLFPNGKSKHRPRSYPSKALYAKYRNKTPERHIQMALASKSGKTPDVRTSGNIQLAGLKLKKPKPIPKITVAQAPTPIPVAKPKTEPAGPAPIILTSAKILEEKAKPVEVTPKPELKEKEIQVTQLATLTPTRPQNDPLNAPLASGLKPLELASLEPVTPTDNPANTPLVSGLKPVELASLEPVTPTETPTNTPLASGLKPVEVAANLDVKIIPAAAVPGEKTTENLSEKLEEKPESQKVKPVTAKIEVASLAPLPESKTPELESSSDIARKVETRPLPPVNIAFSQASLLALPGTENIKMPKVNRAIKGDLQMTTL